MIERDDLRAAVSAGIVTEGQAASLASLADARRGARENLAEGDEPFELFKGFNEIFIVVGLGILATGYTAVAGLYVASALGGWIERVIPVTVFGAILTWSLSEYFIRKRRMVAPAIALSLLWAGNASVGFTAWFAQPFMVAQEDFSSLPVPLALTTVALLVHWLRFKVPFALALVAIGAFIVALVLAADQAGSPRDISDLFLLSAGGPFAWITLALGIVVFGLAMTFDMSDPHRVTRRAANGFWLHVVAAPALVNTVALTLLDGGANALLFVTLMLFAIVAIIIDRRSFLIAAVGYSVALAWVVFDGDGGAWTVLTLGLVLVFLGAFWERIRAMLLKTLKPVLPLKRLPPSVIHD
ncbi:MAG: hypothetical protein AAFQ54_11170 [Pseudomonadota bacterium]